MIELLVSIGILATIASIMAVAYTVVMKKADRTRIAFQFQTIAQALEAYKTEFNSLPVTSLDDSEVIVTGTRPAAITADDEINRDGFRGARTLCKALMGAGRGSKATLNTAFDFNKADQDGKDGFGFAVPSRSGSTAVDDKGTADPLDNDLKGKTYPPYLAPDKFKISRTKSVPNANPELLLDAAPNATTGDKYDDTCVLLDGNGNPILYYPVLNPQPNIGAPTPVPAGFVGAYVGNKGPTTTTLNDPLPMYRGADNSAWLSVAKFRTLMGDLNNNGAIDSGETAAVRGKYVLVSPGPDGFYGVNDNDVAKSAAEKAAKLDDVTNFGE